MSLSSILYDLFEQLTNLISVALSCFNSPSGIKTLGIIRIDLCFLYNMSLI
jgi:hypothetical protein